MLQQWWADHVRPRDAYALLALLLLTGVSALVWATGEGDAGARKDIVAYALGIVAGVGGFYSGARVADRASDRADDADARLAEAAALVAVLRQQVASLSSKEEPEGKL